MRQSARSSSFNCLVNARLLSKFVLAPDRKLVFEGRVSFPATAL
jgi:hypothetical protein